MRRFRHKTPNSTASRSRAPNPSGAHDGDRMLDDAVDIGHEWKIADPDECRMVAWEYPWGQFEDAEQRTWVLLTVCRTDDGDHEYIVTLERGEPGDAIDEHEATTWSEAKKAIRRFRKRVSERNPTRANVGDRERNQHRPRKAQLEKAVENMRIYLGSVGRVRVRDQQRLHNRVIKSVDQIAARTGMEPADVWKQIETEARKRGAVLAQPGRHMNPRAHRIANLLSRGGIR